MSQSISFPLSSPQVQAAERIQTQMQHASDNLQHALAGAAEKSRQEKTETVNETNETENPLVDKDGRKSRQNEQQEKGDSPSEPKMKQRESSVPLVFRQNILDNRWRFLRDTFAGAADDPAGLIISENLRAQISGLGQAVKNAQNAVNLVSTAEAALDEVLNQLRSIRTLALDALNTGASDSVAIAADQTQIASLIATLTRIGNNTQFGKIKLLDGSAGISGSTNDVSKLTFVKGGEKTQTGTYNVTNLTAATKGTTTFNVNNEFQSANGIANATFGLAANEVLTFVIDFADGQNAADSAALGADLTAAGLADDTSVTGVKVRYNEGDATVYVTVDQAAGSFTADTFDGAVSVKDALNSTTLGKVITVWVQSLEDHWG